jgi:hypothetical protein
LILSMCRGWERKLHCGVKWERCGFEAKLVQYRDASDWKGGN